MKSEQSSPAVMGKPLSDRRFWAYAGCTLLVVLVNDGWSGRPNGFAHQLLILPLTICFLLCLWSSLRTRGPGRRERLNRVQILPIAGVAALLVFFEGASLAGFGYESKHFARFGYAIHLRAACVVAVCLLLGVASLWRAKTNVLALGGLLVTYGAGLVFAIRCFPLNYLRSDMLPVIQWADERLVHHANPYGTMHVGARLYDFPYLPGMLLAFWPAVVAHVDPRWVTLVCLIGVVSLIYIAAAKEHQRAATLLMSVFLLSPFLQYRHDLYLAPHWFAMTAAMVLIQRRFFGWAAVVFGVSMALYQLSWVIFPFLLLYALRRNGVWELTKTGILSLAGMLAVVGPFLRSAMSRIASNTVGQWSLLPHALADPMNLSYWLTFVVRPDQLKWIQLAVLTAVFGFSILRGRCRNFVDTLRWMCVSLTIFILLNVIVDGYFYLTLLLLMLVYTCAATGIWPDNTSPRDQQATWRDLPENSGTGRTDSPAFAG